MPDNAGERAGVVPSMSLEQTVELMDMVDQLRALSPEARKEAARFIRSLAEREGIPPPLTDEERRRRSDEVLASLPPLSRDDFEELIRLTREAHDECCSPLCRQP